MSVSKWVLGILGSLDLDWEMPDSGQGKPIRGPNLFFKYFYFLFGPGLLYPLRVIATEPRGAP